jgi:hypothetical protein
MHILSFLLALALLATGIVGIPEGGSTGELRSIAMPGIFFGGAVLIASLYAIMEPRHGLAGATFLAFLAFLTNAATCIGATTGGTYEWASPEHRNATLVLLMCTFYLGAALRSWKHARKQRVIAELENGSPS